MEIQNKKARYDYFVQDELEVGIVLRGNEVKSIRAGRASIKEAWIRVQGGDELVLRGMHITKWDTSNLYDIDEDRERKLLAHKKEIRKLADLVKQEGVTLVPLSVYFSKGKCKVKLGICKGKHNYDKRQSMKEKQMKLDAQRALAMRV